VSVRCRCPSGTIADNGMCPTCGTEGPLYRQAADAASATQGAVVRELRPIVLPMGPPRTQDDWGRRFAERVGTMRHVHGLGWHEWDGARWCYDDTGHAARYMSDLIREGYSELSDLDATEARYALRDLAGMRKAASVNGALYLAAVRPEMAVAVRQVDARPELLNVANGTLDLHTLAIREHRQDDLLTKVCRGAYLPDLGDTRWGKFVAEILPDEDVREFVQRIMGVAAYGRVIEHVLAVMWGRGRNGKSTFIEAVLHALGDYGLQADAKLLMSGASERHSTERADLQGRRFAVCMETAKGSRIDAAMAKQLTGGDTITARRMRQNNISFEPSHTVALITNYKPVIPGDDDALWKRVVLIPFTQRFLGNAADKNLLETLKAESAAVVTWMAHGWRQYREIGLQPPEAVQAATRAYREESDTLGQFLGQRCHIATSDYGLRQPGAGSQVLYESWKSWCHHNGEDPASNKEFSSMLEERGLRKKQTKTGAKWLGVTLLSGDEEPENHWSDG
jgi:putative DNA primase/helicase